MGLVYGNKGGIIKNKLIYLSIVPNVNFNYNVLNRDLVDTLDRIVRRTFSSFLDWF